jgi:hypothetical protein
MAFAVARGRGVLLVAASLVAACSVTRQRVDLAMRGDVPAVDSQGRRVDSSGHGAAGSAFSRRITAAFRCPSDGRGDHGPQACLELGERADREIVGGSLGVAASVLPGVECADLCTQKRISVAPIMAKLGRPPDPGEIARRVAPSGPSNTRVRDMVRRAYEEAVQSRYRSYARYVSEELSDADYVEIGPARGGGTRRYNSGHIYEGVEEALSEMADSYAALEWTRFEREWGHVPGTTRAGTSRGSSAQRPDSPVAPARTGEGDEEGTGQVPAAPPDGPAAPAGPVHQAEKPSPARASTGAGDVTCRRSCSLRYSACLARCRDQPVTGGAYDACSYECSDSSLSCRGACGAIAAP